MLKEHINRLKDTIEILENYFDYNFIPQNDATAFEV